MELRKPTLLLLPNVLDDTLPHEPYFSRAVDVAVSTLDGLIAESEKAARRFLRRFSFSNGRTFRDIPLALLNEHTSAQELEALLVPVLKGQIWGLISDAGLPCLADPGSHLVLQARQKQIHIEAFTGPSSLVLALMLSGLNAQRFAFNGYLPREEESLFQKIACLQSRSQQENSTQLWIEAPYRNTRLIRALLNCLDDETYLCMAIDLTAPTQWVKTATIREWKQGALPDVDKRPAIFLIRAIK